jgi:hypothetical protein
MLEEELTGMANGTAAYSAKEKEISDQRVKVEDIRGQKDTALVVFQSKEMFAQRLDLSLHTSMKLRDRHIQRIARLKSDTEERVVTYKARLVATKIMSDQKFDDNINTIGIALDQQTDEFMGAAMVAADTKMMKDFEAQPERLRQHREVRMTIAEHIANMRDRDADVQKALRDRYGNNLGEESYFQYGRDGGKKQDPAPTN